MEGEEGAEEANRQWREGEYRYVCMIDGEDMGEEGPESVPSEHKLYVCTVAW